MASGITPINKFGDALPRAKRPRFKTKGVKIVLPQNQKVVQVWTNPETKKMIALEMLKKCFKS